MTPGITNSRVMFMLIDKTLIYQTGTWVDGAAASNLPLASR